MPDTRPDFIIIDDPIIRPMDPARVRFWYEQLKLKDRYITRLLTVTDLAAEREKRRELGAKIQTAATYACIPALLLAPVYWPVAAGISAAVCILAVVAGWMKEGE